MKFYASHQDVSVTKSRCQRGETFIAEWEGKLVRTITLSPPGAIGGCEWYERPDVATFGQFAVEPDIQKQGTGSRLMDRAEQRARELGAAEIACDTAEGAHNLIEYYRKRGYRLVGKANWPVVNYESVVLSKSLI
jgi:GNAT superfamily N-acetyltransferase